MASAFLHLASLSMITSRPIHVAAHGTVSFFSWLSGTPLWLYTASFIHSSCQWTFRGRPCPGHGEQRCSEHGGGGGACIELAEKVVRAFHEHRAENPNEMFGQPNIF